MFMLSCLWLAEEIDELPRDIDFDGVRRIFPAGGAEVIVIPAAPHSASCFEIAKGPAANAAVILAARWQCNKAAPGERAAQDGVYDRVVPISAS
jgi:hypothetical protein